MRTYWLLFWMLLAASAAKTQEFSSYEKPLASRFYSEALDDSVSLEITLPKGLDRAANTDYPIIYLLDKQLTNNYQYNLHTIDYLTSLQWMPGAIVVGITFPRKNRTAWTVPNASGGKADDLLRFIEQELNEELKRKYAVSDFHLLIGHSRTAIFSSYALSKSPEFFNGIIANSVSNFDFGDSLQQAQFEDFLHKIGTHSHKYYYYFSVGEAAYGDLHETAVDTLNQYLLAKELPKNLEWKFYKHPVAHDLTPGVTVGKALSEIFEDYGRRITLCFELAEESANEVPWEAFEGLYASISSELGLEIQPSELFYNSIASMYYNDYDGIYGDKKLEFCLEILLKAIEQYPDDFGYFMWIGEIYISLQDFEQGESYLNNAVELLNRDKSVPEVDRINYLEEIETLRESK